MNEESKLDRLISKIFLDKYELAMRILNDYVEVEKDIKNEFKENQEIILLMESVIEE